MKATVGRSASLWTLTSLGVFFSDSPAKSGASEKSDGAPEFLRSFSNL